MKPKVSCALLKTKKIFQYLCPFLSGVWSEGQLDRPRLFLSHLILCAVQLTQSQQKICTGNCKTQSCPDNKKLNTSRPDQLKSTKSVIPTVTLKNFPAVR